MRRRWGGDEAAMGRRWGGDGNGARRRRRVMGCPLTADNPALTIRSQHDALCSGSFELSVESQTMRRAARLGRWTGLTVQLDLH